VPRARGMSDYLSIVIETPMFDKKRCGVPASKDGVRVLKPSIPSINKDAKLDTVVNETTAEMTVVTNINHHDDKRVSWLQHPFHGSLKRKYCFDVFGEKTI